MAHIPSTGGQAGFGDAEFPEAIATSLFGQRYWHVNSRQLLQSITKSQYHWRPGKNEATCLRNMNNLILENSGRLDASGKRVRPLKTMHEEQQIPVAVCGCGFWAYWADQASVSLNNKTAVSGIMEGWGKLIVGPFGFRAQYARIVALCPPAEHKYKTLSLNLTAMRAQYPGVKWYGSYGEMITAHPTPNAFTQLKLDAPDQFYD